MIFPGSTCGQCSEKTGRGAAGRCACRTAPGSRHRHERLSETSSRDYLALQSLWPGTYANRWRRAGRSDSRPCMPQVLGRADLGCEWESARRRQDRGTDGGDAMTDIEWLAKARAIAKLTCLKDATACTRFAGVKRAAHSR